MLLFSQLNIFPSGGDQGGGVMWQLINRQKNTLNPVSKFFWTRAGEYVTLRANDKTGLSFYKLGSLRQQHPVSGKFESTDLSRVVAYRWRNKKYILTVTVLFVTPYNKTSSPFPVASLDHLSGTLLCLVILLKQFPPLSQVSVCAFHGWFQM